MVAIAGSLAPSPARSQPPGRLDFLDVARGVAALLVMVEHGLHQSLPGYLEQSRSSIIIGQASILVFFMISGFVIPMTLEEGRSTARFWLRRCFRLLPVYWLSIATAFLYLVLGGPLPLEVSLSEPKVWAANVLLLQKVLGLPNVWGVFWSLHFELALYVVFSGLFACGVLRRIGARSFAVLIAGFAAAFSAAALVGKSPGNGDMRLVVLAALVGFMAQRYLSGQMGKVAFYGLLAGVFAAAVIVWGVNRAVFSDLATVSQLTRWLSILGLACLTFIGLLEFRHLKMPAIGCWLGNRSYPIYLLHPIVLHLLAPTGWPAAIFVPSLTAATLVIADLAHRFIELPSIALGRRLTARPKPTPTPAVELGGERKAA